MVCSCAQPNCCSIQAAVLAIAIPCCQMSLSRLSCACLWLIPPLTMRNKAAEDLKTRPYPALHKAADSSLTGEMCKWIRG